MKCETCNNEATVFCSWGLYEPGCKIKDKYLKKRNNDEYYYDYVGCYDRNEIYEDYRPREEKMNEANLCDECSNKLWKSCKGAVNAQVMYWMNRKI